MWTEVKCANTMMVVAAKLALCPWAEGLKFRWHPPTDKCKSFFMPKWSYNLVTGTPRLSGHWTTYFAAEWTLSSLMLEFMFGIVESCLSDVKC